MTRIKITSKQLLEIVQLARRRSFLNVFEASGFESFAAKSNLPPPPPSITLGFDDDDEEEKEEENYKGGRKKPYYEADPPSILGKIAFAPQRKGDGVPPEDNLDLENSMIKDFNEYINTSGRDLDSKTLKALQYIISKNEYDDVVMEPEPSDQLHRGMVLPTEAMEKLAERAGLDMDEIRAGSKYEVDFVFQPRPGIMATSWSFDPKVAAGFSRRPASSKGKFYSIILNARASNNPNKFVDINPLYDVVKAEHMSGEKEAIGLGDIKVSFFEIVNIFDNQIEYEPLNTKSGFDMWLDKKKEPPRNLSVVD